MTENSWEFIFQQLFCTEGTSQAETLTFKFDAATYETLHWSNATYLVKMHLAVPDIVRSCEKSYISFMSSSKRREL